MNIKIVQRKDRIYADGRCPLFFRFTQKRQCKYISTGIALTQEFWNETEQRITESCPDSESLNWQLKEKLAEYQKQIDYLKNIGKVGSAVKYTSCNHLLEQCGLGRKRFEQIDLQYLQDFEAFLIRKGNTSNSIATKFSVLRAVYNKAVKHKVFAETENPFKQYNVGRFWKPTRKRAITKEDVQRIQSLELPASTEVYSTAFARDIFLFSYCVAGINFKDIYTRYSEIRREKPIMLTTDWETELAEAVYPFIRDAYTKLGDPGRGGISIHKGRIHETRRPESQGIKIQGRSNTGRTDSDVKEELQKIYDTLGIGKRAKATDMEQWYETATMSRKIEGKTVSCMTIIMNRLARTDF